MKRLKKLALDLNSEQAELVSILIEELYDVDEDELVEAVKNNKYKVFNTTEELAKDSLKTDGIFKQLQYVELTEYIDYEGYGEMLVNNLDEIYVQGESGKYYYIENLFK